MDEKQQRPTKTKRVVIVKNKGTAQEQRTVTNIPMYWVEAWKRWVTIPPKGE